MHVGVRGIHAPLLDAPAAAARREPAGSGHSPPRWCSCGAGRPCGAMVAGAPGLLGSAPLRLSGPAPHRDGARSRGGGTRSAGDRCLTRFAVSAAPTTRTHPSVRDPYHRVQRARPARLRRPACLPEAAAPGRRRAGASSGRTWRSWARRTTKAPAIGRAAGSARTPSGRPPTTRVRSTRCSSTSSRSTGWTCADAGDAPVVPGNPERAHEVIRRKVAVVTAGRRHSDRAGRRPLDHLAGGHRQWPRAWRRAGLGIVHFDAHADTAATTWGSLRSHGTPMRRLIESGAVAGRNFVQVGLRGYWPPPETLDWMRANGLRSHFMTEIEERGAEAVVADAIAEALDGPERHLPVGRHRRPRSGHGARHRHARAGRHAEPRAAARHPPGGDGGRAGRAWTWWRWRLPTTWPRSRPRPPTAA